MKVHTRGFSPTELIAEIARGGRFVFFEYCISVLIVTTRRPSDIYFVCASEWSWLRGLPFSLLSLLLGWWGMPWGIIYTPLVLANNLAGGCDVTDETIVFLGLDVKEVR